MSRKNKEPEVTEVERRRAAQKESRDHLKGRAITSWIGRGGQQVEVAEQPEMTRDDRRAIIFGAANASRSETVAGKSYSTKFSRAPFATRRKRRRAANQRAKESRRANR